MSMVDALLALLQPAHKRQRGELNRTKGELQRWQTQCNNINAQTTKPKGGG